MMSGPVLFAVLTVSDRCSVGEAEDTSGPALTRIMTQRMGARCVGSACVPDDVDAIRGAILSWTRHDPPPDVVLTTGGTGLAPRDVTPEAVAEIVERPYPALLELARLRCYEKTPRAFLSRGTSGIVGRSLVATLPGSERGATETLEAVIDILPHAVEILRGDNTDHARPKGGG